MLGLVALVVAVSGGSAAVPVPAALYSNSDANVLAVSCAAAGDCVAGGFYVLADGYSHQAFVVSETNGVWGKPIEVPGTEALNRNRDALVDSVSCPAAGDCVAGGAYTDVHGNSQAFLVSETNGAWGKAIEVPGIAALTPIGADVDSVSCDAVGDCAAGGLYFDGAVHPFVVSEKNGVWGDAIAVPGTAALNSGDADGTYVSCAASGDCAAGGQYTDALGHKQAFVASEKNGTWGDAIEVPGTATLNLGGDAGVESISCAAAGECVAGGHYTDVSGHRQAFVVSETSGVWGNAIEVPGTGTLNSGGNAGVSSVSCPAAGDCTAAGSYKDGSGHVQAFVASETSGTWGSAIEVPGSATLNGGGSAVVSSVSCGAVDDCAVGGSYKDSSGRVQAFVASETSGNWGNAIEVPGTATLNTHGKGGVSSISCAAAGDCTAGGFYDVKAPFRTRAFAVSETNGTWSNATAVRKFPVFCVVPHVVGKSAANAKIALIQANCGIGKITRAYSTTKYQYVVAQHTKPGRKLPRGAKIDLVVSLGKGK
jgi:hypothetical protein